MQQKRIMKMANASGWNNGNPDYKTGSGLGLHIDSHYWSVIFNNSLFNSIDIFHNEISIAQNFNVSNKACQELIHVGIVKWLIQNNWHIWPQNIPHRFTIRQNGIK